MTFRETIAPFIRAHRPIFVEIFRGELDYYFKPIQRNTNYRWVKSDGPNVGGPFNGQQFRQQLFVDLLQEFDFRAIVEAGTFRGVTTQFISEQARRPIFTIESSPRNFGFSRARHRGDSHITNLFGDSRQILNKLAGESDVPKTNVFFYLDAHWGEDLPLREEIELIAEYWQDSIIMVDDFQVPGDPGYLFDDYGPGKRLCLDYVGPTANFDAYFPAVSSAQETGFKRGCVVLAQKTLSARMQRLLSLKPGV